MDGEPVHYLLGHDEALVLFERLASYGETEQLTADGPAEKLARCRLHGVLEKALVAPLSADYAERMRRARDHLREQAADS